MQEAYQKQSENHVWVVENSSKRKELWKLQLSHRPMCGFCDQNLSTPSYPSSQKVTRLSQTARIARKG